MGTECDIRISHNPRMFNRDSSPYINLTQLFQCGLQTRSNSLPPPKPNHSPNLHRTISLPSPHRKPARPCLVIRDNQGDEGGSSNSSGDENDPISPTRQKKKVVFADDRGFSLTQIRLMVEPPPIESPAPYTKPLSKLFAGLESGTKNKPPSKEPNNTWKVAFSQPASNYLDFRRKLNEENVSLENIIVKNGENQIIGTVKVKNICYEKSVFIRYTKDNWKTQNDVPCTFVENNTNLSVKIIYDTFSLKLDLPNDANVLEFCVCFKGGDKEYWDNNNGKNYKLMKNEAINKMENTSKRINSMFEASNHNYEILNKSHSWPGFTTPLNREGAPYW